MTTTVGLPALSSTGVPANTSGSDKTAMSLPYHNTVEPAIDGDVPGSIPDDNDSDPGDADDADKEPAIAADALAGGSDSKVFFKWASSQLDKFLRATNGALTKGIVKWIAKNLTGTKLILVVGKTGTGKSTFLKELTGHDVDIGCSMKSGTIEYCVCPAIIGDQQYVFIDTVGLAAADVPNDVAFQDLLSCISTLGNFMHVAGVLLVLDSRADRVTNDDVKVFKWLNCFCGPTYYRNITVVFSQWDRLVPDEFEDHKANARLLVEQPELAAILKPHRPYLGGSVYYHGIPGGDMVDGVIALSKKRHAAERSQEAKNMILRRYSDKTGGQLQIVQDMAANKNNWKLTEAGKVLLAGNPAQIELVIQDDRAVVTYPDHHYQPRLSPSGLAPPASATQAVVPEPGAAEPAGPDPAAAGDPAGATPEEAPGFLDSIRTWVDIARAVAQFFGGARTAGAEPAGWSIRGALRTLGSWLWG